MNTADSSDPFDFELTPADLKIIERQATQLMMQTDIQGTNELAGQIHELQHQTNILSEELLQLRREKPTREGEISILRQRLNQAESEKYEMCRQHVEKLETMEQARQALLRHYEREVERFQTELKFKQNEAHFTSAVKGSTIEETSLNFHSTQVMHVNSFAGTFGDLTGISKRAKVEKSIRRESSCETDSLGNPMETLRISEIGPSELELQDMLYRAMGHADFVFSKEDIATADQDLALEKRQSIQKMATLSKNVFLALEYEYLQVSKNETNVLVHYVTLILEFFTCLNAQIGSMWRNGTIPPYSVSPKIKMQLGKDIILPESSNLIQDMCNYLAKLPNGICMSIVHQHLRILKHIYYGHTGSFPDCVFRLVENGTLLGKLNGFSDPLLPEILIDVTQFASMMTDDRRLGMALVKQHGPPLDCSLLNLLNDILLKSLVDKPYYELCDEFEHLIIQFLFNLVVTRTLPASVSFEPATLRHFCRRLSLLAWNTEKKDLTTCQSDVLVFIQILHQIIVVEKAPIVKFVVREFINLLYSVQVFVADPAFHNLLKDFLGPMIPILEASYGDIVAGKYLLSPLPKVIRRKVPLTEEEERALYKLWTEGADSAGLEQGS